MAAGDTTQGRRRDDVNFFDLPPDDLEHGDYWRYLDRKTGKPMHVEESGNLTGGVWGVCCPVIGGIGLLRLHTVREHEDGTITVAPGDGSSNSILIGDGQRSWHGYIDHGVWREV